MKANKVLEYAYTTGLIEKKVRKALVKQCGQKQIKKDGSIISSHAADTAQFILNNPNADILQDIVQAIALAIYSGDISIEVKKVIKQETDTDNETPIEVETDIEYVTFCTENDMKAFYRTIYATLLSYKTVQPIEYAKGQQADDSQTGHTINANDYLWSTISNEDETVIENMLTLSAFNEFFAYALSTGIQKRTVSNMETIIKDILEGLRYQDIANTHKWTVSKVKTIVSTMRDIYKRYRTENPHKKIDTNKGMQYGTTTYTPIIGFYRRDDKIVSNVNRDDFIILFDGSLYNPNNGMYYTKTY